MDETEQTLSGANQPQQPQTWAERIQSFVGPLPNNIRTSLDVSQERTAQRVSDIHQPDVVVDPTTMESLRQTLFRETLLAFSGTLTRTMKAYLRGHISSTAVARQSISIVVAEIARAAVEAINAGVDDVDTYLENWTEEQTRVLIENIFSRGQQVASNQFRRVVQDISGLYSLSDIEIPYTLSRKIENDEVTVPAELRCPIMQSLMVNPVLLVTVDGQSVAYDKNSLVLHQRANGLTSIDHDFVSGSPLDKNQVQMLPSHDDRNAIKAFIYEQMQLIQDESAESTVELSEYQCQTAVFSCDISRCRAALQFDERLETHIGTLDNVKTCYPRQDLSANYDPFTQKLMLRPVILQGVTLDFSSLEADLLQLRNVDGGITITLPSSDDDTTDSRIYTFRSWGALLDQVRDNTTARTRISGLINRVATAYGIEIGVTSSDALQVDIGTSQANFVPQADGQELSASLIQTFLNRLGDDSVDTVQLHDELQSALLSQSGAAPVPGSANGALNLPVPPHQVLGSGQGSSNEGLSMLDRLRRQSSGSAVVEEGHDSVETDESSTATITPGDHSMFNDTSSQARSHSEGMGR